MTKRQGWLITPFAVLAVGGCFGGGGGVPVVAAIASFTITPNPVAVGGTMTLAWRAVNAGLYEGFPYCTLQRTVVSVPTEPAQAVTCTGTLAVTAPPQPTAMTYRLSALRRDGLGYITRDVAVTVSAAAPATMRGWTHPGADLTGSRYYASGSTVAGGGSPHERWRHTFASVTSEGVLTGDVNGNGALDIVTVQGGTLYVFDSAGTARTQVGIGTGTGSNPHVHMLEDANGDGVLDIGIGYLRHNTSGPHETRIYSGTGALLFDVFRAGSIDGYGMMPITVIGGDVIVFESAGYARQPRGFSRWRLADGAMVWEYNIGPNYQGFYSVADINDDGKLDFAFGNGTPHNGASANGTTDDNVYTVVVNESGVALLSELYPYAASTKGDLKDAFVRFAPAERHQLVSFKGYQAAYRGTSRVHVRELNGTIVHTADGIPNAQWNFGWADLDGDGIHELIAANWSETDHTAVLSVFNRYLAVQHTIAYAANIHRPVVRAIADVDGDGRPEILVSQGDTLTAFDHELVQKWQWSAGGSTIWNAIVSDLDGNGRLEVIVLTEFALVILE